MEYGLIKDTTMKGIADGLREKGIIEKHKKISYDSISHVSDNATSPTDPTPVNPLKVTIKKEYNYTIPEASSLEVHLKIKHNGGAINSSYPTYTSISLWINTILASWYMNAEEMSQWGTNENEFVITLKSNKVRIEEDYIEAPFAFASIATIYPLDSNGNRITITEVTEEINTLSPGEIVKAINGCLPPPPESAFKISGNCQSKFAYDGWNWFLNNYGDKITTDNITYATDMFHYNPIERILMEINLADSCTNTQYIFGECTNLVELPVVNNFANSASICSGCNNLVSLNGNKFKTPEGSIYADSLFSNCYKLRTVDGFFDNVPDEIKGTSIFGLYNTFTNCYSLDEVLNLPYIYSTYNSMYFFGSMVSGCYRLKRLTFRNQVVTKSTKSATLDLTNIGCAVAYFGSDANTMRDKTDFTDETLVTDDASYQALKDNPDWWTDNVAYSRYNHDSAVETINSLPDVTATGVTNTIKFKGAAGSNTDGGAINTLTAEEIAVATAKGWTVTLE